MNNEFAPLEKTLNAMAANLKPANIAKVSRAAATALKQSNARRLAQNIEPSGEKFTPRRKNSYSFRPKTQARFLYPTGGSGAPRLVQLSAWTVFGSCIYGFDEKRGAKRKFHRDKIIKWLPNLRPKLDNRAHVLKPSKEKTGKMFKKARKLLNRKQDNEGFEVGFFNPSQARLLAIHHYGKIVPVSKKSPRTIRYPKRELVGVSKDDIRLIEDKIFKLFDVRGF